MSGVGGAHVTRKLTAILAADVVGFSRMMGVDEEATLERLKAHRKHLIDPKIAEHQGRIVKTTGDGLLVEWVYVVGGILEADILMRTTGAPSASATAARRRRWLGALAAVVVVAIAMPLAWHLTARPGSEAPLTGADRSSIAVLRFADFG